MTNLKTLIYKHLNEALTPIALSVVDESDQHIGHTGYQGGGRHFFININAPHSFAGLSRVEAHRKIYAALADLMPPIHALRIKIE